MTIDDEWEAIGIRHGGFRPSDARSNGTARVWGIMGRNGLSPDDARRMSDAELLRLRGLGHGSLRILRGHLSRTTP
jgi:hypothetical protein